MRKLKMIEHISMDGVIQAGGDTDGGFPYGDWSGPYRTPAGLAMVLPEYGERFDVLIGRKTFDQWVSFWPKAPKNAMTDRLNAATKYVVTHRPDSLADADWGRVEAVGPNLVEGVRALKAMEGPDLILSGSSTLTSVLLEHGLADEILMLVNPVFLGKGKRFFAEGSPARSFELISTATSPTGVLINKYKFSGPLKNL